MNQPFGVCVYVCWNNTYIYANSYIYANAMSHNGVTGYNTFTVSTS